MAILFGRIDRPGLLQVLAMGLSAGMFYASAFVIVPVTAGYLGSTWWYGTVLERRLL